VPSQIGPSQILIALGRVQLANTSADALMVLWRGYATEDIDLTYLESDKVADFIKAG
jgi:hypothetical protein